MYVLIHGPCYACKRVFAYNPNHVPSLRIKGTREPFCRDCVERANTQRVAVGKPAHPIHPEAYEPCDEREVKW